jgi:predicted nucleic acid-binding protein
MKPIFVDTSAFYALFDQGDRFHQAAANVFFRFSPDGMLLVSWSYVVLETLSLLQTRIGMSAVRKWKTEFQPILEIISVDRQLHE